MYTDYIDIFRRFVGSCCPLRKLAIANFLVSLLRLSHEPNIGSHSNIPSSAVRVWVAASFKPPTIKSSAGACCSLQLLERARRRVDVTLSVVFFKLYTVTTHKKSCIDRSIPRGATCGARASKWQPCNCLRGLFS